MSLTMMRLLLVGIFTAMHTAIAFSATENLCDSLLIIYRKVPSLMREVSNEVCIEDMTSCALLEMLSIEKVRSEISNSRKQLHCENPKKRIGVDEIATCNHIIRIPNSATRFLKPIFTSGTAQSFMHVERRLTGKIIASLLSDSFCSDFI